jgi:hypothetical protein
MATVTGKRTRAAVCWQGLVALALLLLVMYGVRSWGLEHNETEELNVSAITATAAEEGATDVSHPTVKQRNAAPSLPRWEHVPDGIR